MRWRPPRRAQPRRSRSADPPLAEHQVDTWYQRVAEREVAVGVRRAAVEVEGVVNHAAVAVVEDDRQAIERRIAGAAVEQLDKLRGVGAGIVGVEFVDHDLRRDGRRRILRRE